MRDQEKVLRTPSRSFTVICTPSGEKPEDDKEQDVEKAARKFDSPGENETPIAKKGQF